MTTEFSHSLALIQTFTVDPVNELTNVTRTGTLTVSGAMPGPVATLTVNGLAVETNADFTFASSNNFTLTNGNNTFTVIAQNVYGVFITNTLTANLPGTNTLQFDGGGNLTNDGARSFSYDAENELTNVTVAGNWKSDFVYDGFGRRRIIKDFAWQSGAWVETNETRYIYDGLLAVQERDTNNNVLVTYTRGLDFSGSLQDVGGIGGLLARTDANGPTFYHSDGAGNITALMDGNQYMVARYLYDPFGKLVGRWGVLADANAMQFSSMPRHRNSGLVLYPFRAYEPNLQRWLNHDPIQELGGANLYNFVFNSPLQNFDPWGLQAVEGSERDLDREREELAREIDQMLLRNGRYWNSRFMSDADLEKIVEEIDRNTRESNEKFEPNEPYQGKGPIMRAAIPKGQKPNCPTVVRYVGPREAWKARETGFIPNVNSKEEPRATFVTPDEVELDPSKVEVKYQLGQFNPLGPSQAPTHAIIGDASSTSFNYGGNVENGQGSELTTYNQIPVIVIIPLRPAN
jgi:RHS repeat-associated protein